MIDIQEIRNIVGSFGIPGNYLGFRYLVHAVSLGIEDEDNLLFVTKRIYPIVAKEFQTNAACVERDLRTVVKICWERGNRELLNDYAKYEMSSKPSTGEFIAIISNHIRREKENQSK